MSNKKKYFIGWFILLANILVSFLLMFIYVLMKGDTIFQLNEYIQLKYILVAVSAQIIGLILITCKKENPWIKETISVIVMLSIFYFIPLSIEWHKREVNLKHIIEMKYSNVAFTSSWFYTFFDEPRPLLFQIRYFMLVTMIVLLCYLITEIIAVFARQKKRFIKFVIYGSFVCLSLGVNTYYIVSEQITRMNRKWTFTDLASMMRYMEKVNLNVNFRQGVDDELKNNMQECVDYFDRGETIYGIIKYISTQEPIQELRHRGYDYMHTAYNIAWSINWFIDNYNISHKQLQILNNDLQQIISSYEEFVKEEGMVWYLGVYTPRNYEAKVSKWLKKQYDQVKRDMNRTLYEAAHSKNST